MGETDTLGSWRLAGFLLALIAGALVVLIDALLGRPAPFGLRVTRIGQLLFVAAFVAGGSHFASRDEDWRAVGFLLIAAGWALLFADGPLGGLTRDVFVPAVVGVMVLGCVSIVYGLDREERRSEPDLDALFAED